MLAVFTSNYNSPSLFSSLSASERQNVTFNIHNKPPRQSPRVPWCQMTSRLSGVTRQPGRSPNTRRSSAEVT